MLQRNSVCWWPAYPSRENPCNLLTMLRTLSLAVLLIGCGKDTAPKPAESIDSNETFVAFPATFQAFRTWTSFHDDGPPNDGTLPVAVLGPRTQYINKLPAHGTKEFPVGTVIVEARESGQMFIFAAAKRGGGFNVNGANNWEWFELTEDATSKAVTIQWRGTAPPAGAYGGMPNTGCNDCHMACGAANDYVCSPELQLARF